MTAYKNLLSSILLPLLLAGCSSAYYSTMEQFGVEKREILVDRIEDTRDTQAEAQEQFRDALEQYRSVVNFEGGDLENLYEKLRDEYEESDRVASRIAERIRKVETVAEDLFEEWQEELELINNPSLRRDSEAKLRDTRRRSEALIAAMWRAEETVHPVLDSLRDQVYYLKHNLNARAISALRGEQQVIDSEVNRLISRMQEAINEADAFINAMQ